MPQPTNTTRPPEAAGPIEQPLTLEGVESRPLGSPDDPPTVARPDWLPMALAGFGFAVLAWTLVRMYIRRKNSTSAREMNRPPAERLADIRSEARARREPLDELMADATELAHRLAAQLDNKAERLEQLLAEADDAIAALRAERAATGGEAARRGPRDHAPASPWGESPTRETDAGDPVRLRVYQLADEGVEPGEIARRLNQPRGQVELMLALRRA